MLAETNPKTDPSVAYGNEIASLIAQVAAATAAGLAAKAVVLQAELDGRVAALITDPGAPYSLPNDRLLARRWSTGGVYELSVSEIRGAWFGYINLKDYCVGDGVTDDTVGFQAAITAAVAAHHNAIFCPVAEYLITGVLTVPEGIVIMGPGSQGSTEQFGCTIKHASNGNLFLFDGNGAANAGTGGGLKNMLILKETGYSGGDAVKLLATDDNHRPGEMMLENILIYGIGTGLWARGVNIDGTACVTPGGKGVRSVVMIKVRAADCTTNNEYIVVNQGNHITGTHVQVDVGHGTGTVGMTLKGDSENVSFVGLVCNGNLIVNDNVIQLSIVGRVTGLDVEGTAVNGSAILSGTAGLALTNKSRDFKVVCEKTDGFFAYRTSIAANKTGDNTSADVTYDVEDCDQNVSFDPASGEITFLCAGFYHLDAQIMYTSIGAAHGRSDSYILVRTSAGAVVHQLTNVANPFAVATTGQWAQRITATVRVNYGDKCKVVCNISGSTKTVNVYGAAGTSRHTWFGAKYLP